MKDFDVKFQSVAIVLLMVTGLVPVSADINVGRVDIDGRKANVVFEPGESSGIPIKFANWLKPADVKKHLTARFQGKSVKWVEGKFSFTPKTDGKIEIALMGPHIKGGEKTKLKPIGIYFDQVKVNGKLIRNGSFEEGAKGWWLEKSKENIPARIIEDQNIVFDKLVYYSI